jgi:signal transduction histidine kinase
MSRPEPRSKLSQIATPSAESALVWVVDDSAMERELCRSALASRWVVETFPSGAAMIEGLAAQRAPQALVLDWHMPDMSGIDVCQFVRTSFDLGQLPILILTVSSAEESLIEALAAGANDFVQKPFSDLELNARVAGLVRMSSLYAKLAEAERTLRVEADFRERFMGMLAHDLRQPLNTIFLASHAISQPVGSVGHLPEAFGMLQRAAGRMQRMIADLLDFTRSRPESGIPIQRSPTDFVQIVRATWAELRPGQQLCLQADESCLGSWDPDRLAQLCSNLIGNAIQHSAADSPIEVRIQAVGHDVELCVSNRGETIPPEVLATLFQPFRRGREVRRASGSVGLGLYIVDQIARAHGGASSAQSDSSGTHFRVRLPRNGA